MGRPSPNFTDTYEYTASAPPSTEPLVLWLGVALTIGGLTSLAGWAFDVRRLTSWFGDAIVMQPNSALSASAAGAALVAHSFGRPVVTRTLGALCLILGLVTLTEHMSGWSFGVDTLLMFGREWGGAATVAPGRMGIPASTSYVLIGIALQLEARDGAARWWIPLLGITVSAIAAASLIGRVYGANTLYAVPRTTAIAAQTAMFVLAAGIALIGSVPDREPMRTLLANSAAGMIARRSLPLAVGVTLLLGYLQVRGQLDGLYDNAMGSALLVLVLISMTCALFWWGVATLNVRERRIRAVVAARDDARKALTATESRTEQQARSFIEALPGGAAFVVDKELRYILAGGEALRIAGLSSEHFVGKTIFEALEPGEAQLREPNLRGVLSGTPFMHEHEAFGRSYESRGVPLRNESGEVYAALVLSHDVTERRAAEQLLRDTNRGKDEFLATLAHELRNPLAPITNALEMLRWVHEPERIEALRVTMDRQVTHMVRLIDDLMDISRITSNKLVLRMERVDLVAILRNAVNANSPLIAGAGHTLRVTIPDEPILLEGDAARLTQVFDNLLTNARRYTEPGGTITVNVLRDSREVSVIVADTGIGIPTDMLQRIFEPFTQVDRSLERTHGGLGIGLSLVQRLVNKHGGFVVAESSGDGTGSTFTVRLPLLNAMSSQEQAGPIPGNGTASTNGAAANGAVQRILVVDDNRDAAESLVLLLQMHGNTTAVAFDGADAIVQAEILRPDVVLMDIGLPVINGYDACRAIRSKPWGEGITMIALTGWGQDADRRRSRDAGFDAHLVKPVDHAALQKMLDERLRSHAEAVHSPAAEPS